MGRGTWKNYGHWLWDFWKIPGLPAKGVVFKILSFGVPRREDMKHVSIFLLPSLSPLPLSSNSSSLHLILPNLFRVQTLSLPFPILQGNDDVKNHHYMEPKYEKVVARQK